jgi:PIN domain nuclease of toxin-antitoxin system
LSAVIALDTHVVLWWTLEPKRLSAAARRAIEDSETLGVAAIVFWEVALLTRKRKVELGTTAEEWARDVLSLPRVVAHDLTPAIALRAERLKMHPDPADRFLVATALEHDLSLVTSDALIRRSKLVRTIW